MIYSTFHLGGGGGYATPSSYTPIVRRWRV